MMFRKEIKVIKQVIYIMLIILKCLFSELKKSQYELITSKIIKEKGQTDFLKGNLKRHLEKLPTMNPMQLEMLKAFNTYKDFYFPQRTFENGESIRFVYTLHALNHILKTRDKIVNNNAKLAKNKGN